MRNTDCGEMRVAVKCKHCGWTIFYKTTHATGIVECKCPRCKTLTTINLAFRKSACPIFYRRSHSNIPA